MSVFSPMPSTPAKKIGSPAHPGCHRTLWVCLLACLTLIARPPAALSSAPGFTSSGTPALSYEIYQSCPGDTVQNVAARFGVSVQQVCAINRISADSELTPGQSLIIVLPRPAAEASETPARQQPRPIETCYAVLLAPAPITTEPQAGRLLYQAEAGSRIIVSSEIGGSGSHEACFGVVMVDGSTGWVPKSVVRLTRETIAPDKLDIMLRGGRPEIVQEAFRYLGTPYRYGGRLPYDIDCSLLVQAVFASHGLRLPRTAAAQCEIGTSVSYRELLPGDRLYFVSRSGRIDHTGIYIGDGSFIHASSRRGRVAVDSLSDSLYWTRFVGARRS